MYTLCVMIQITNIALKGQETIHIEAVKKPQYALMDEFIQQLKEFIIDKNN